MENYTGKYLKVVTRDGYEGIEPTEQSKYNVVVLPYIAQYNRIKQVGILHEWNPMREGSYSNTLVTGDVEIGERPIDGAIRELYEETGYRVRESDRWTYLGKMTTHKSVSFQQYCWTVNIRGIKQRERITDGSQAEQKSDFRLVDISEVYTFPDCYVHTLLLRLLHHIGRV